MKRRYAVSNLLVGVMLIGSVEESGARWLRPDRVKHFFLSFFVQSAGYSVARAANVDHRSAIFVASGVTAAAAVGKEVWDRKRGTGFDRGDLVADALGAGAATALLLRTVE